MQRRPVLSIVIIAWVLFVGYALFQLLDRPTGSGLTFHDDPIPPMVNGRFLTPSPSFEPWQHPIRVNGRFVTPPPSP